MMSDEIEIAKLDEQNLVIGLDIGTSSLKLVVLNLSTNRLELELLSSTAQARLSINKTNVLFDEQCVSTLVSLVKEMLYQVPVHLWKRVKAWQLCGQMHGILFWNRKTGQHSNLVTWQDARCTDSFLDALPVKSKNDLKSGFGCATLFWLFENDKSALNGFDSSGTIMDYITFLLSNEVSMSVHNAMSWGFFEPLNFSRGGGVWQKDLLDYKPFPSNLLTKHISQPGQLISNLTQPFNSQIIELNLSSQVYTALSDLQCSVYSCLESGSNDCVVNISTSAQACFAVEHTEYEKLHSSGLLPPSIAMVPYFGGRVLLVAASLNGGNVLDKLANTALNWIAELGVETSTISRELVWKRLIDSCSSSMSSERSRLVCKPKLFGERHDTRTFGSIGNIRSDNTSLASLFDAVCLGLVRNLRDMITNDLLKQAGCKRVVATGSALSRNLVLRRHLSEQFAPLECVFKDSSSADAALGAAYFLRDILI